MGKKKHEEETKDEQTAFREHRWPSNRAGGHLGGQAGGHIGAV
jgi:hypothetical protein